MLNEMRDPGWRMAVSCRSLDSHQNFYGAPWSTESASWTASEGCSTYMGRVSIPFTRRAAALYSAMTLHDSTLE